MAEPLQLRVWWIPQVPMKPFLVPVHNLREAKVLLEALAHYDLFQFDNRIKPDYCNAGGLSTLKDGDWNDFIPDELDVLGALDLPDNIDDLTYEQCAALDAALATKEAEPLPRIDPLICGRISLVAERECPGLADAHQYLSTACFHELHQRCRKQCKFCDTPCSCLCHSRACPKGGEHQWRTDSCRPGEFCNKCFAAKPGER